MWPGRPSQPYNPEPDHRARSRTPLERYRSIHLVIGPGGVLVVDSKQYRGRLQAVPWGVRQADGVAIVPARRLPDLLQALPPILGPERVAWLADRARLRFRAAA
jgi:hypothetical protein